MVVCVKVHLRVGLCLCFTCADHLDNERFENFRFRFVYFLGNQTEFWDCDFGDLMRFY